MPSRRSHSANTDPDGTAPEKALAFCHERREGSWGELLAHVLDLVGELAADHDKQHAAAPSAAVSPRMVGAALNDEVARLQAYLSFIQNHAHFAFEHQAIVNRFGAMHVWCFRGLGGCNIEHPNPDATLIDLKVQGNVYGIALNGEDWRRRLCRSPDVEQHGPRPAQIVGPSHAIRDHHRAALAVVSGDDSSYHVLSMLRCIEPINPSTREVQIGRA